MKRQVFFATVFSAALAIGTAAQTPTGAQAGAQQDRDRQTVTVTGCLQQDTQAAAQPGAGTPGAPGQRAGTTGEMQFVLTNAEMKGGAGATGTAAGTTGTRAEKAKRFQLSGGKQEELRKYVNSRVEVRGTLDMQAGKTGAGVGTGTATGAAGQGARAGDEPRLRVTSVRQIAADCQQR